MATPPATKQGEATAAHHVSGRGQGDNANSRFSRPSASRGDVAQPHDAAPERVVAAPEVVAVKEEAEARAHHEAREDEPPPRDPVQGVERAHVGGHGREQRRHGVLPPGSTLRAIGCPAGGVVTLQAPSHRGWENGTCDRRAFFRGPRRNCRRSPRRGSPR
jgi:hypothetical protein